MPEDKTPAIRKEYNPDDQEKQDINFVYTRKRQMEESPDRIQALAKADKGRKAWESWREDKQADQWQSNHKVPMTFSVIETAHSEVIKLMLRPKIGPQGLEDEPRARIMSHMFNYTCNVSDFDVTIADIWQDSLIEGTAIAQEYYWVDKRLVQTVSIGEDKKEKTEEHEVVDYDDCYLESVRLADFFVDETAEGFMGPRAARDCIRRYIMDIEDFRAFFQGELWDPLGNAKYVKAGGDVNYYEWYKPPEGIDHSTKVEVLWYWSKKPNDKLWIVANDVLIKRGGNPYKHKQLPFARNVDVKRTHKFYGKGQPEILESIQDEADVMRRMIIDRNHLDIDKMFIVSSRTALNDEDLIARPHGMIPSDDTNGAKAVEYGDIPRSVEISYKHLEDDAIISTGINPRSQSLPVAGSATEAAILKESTLKRIEKKVWYMKKEFLPIVARLRCANILQFYSQPRLEEIVGDRESQDFISQTEKLREQGMLVEDGDKTYKKEFRSIPIENKEIGFDAKGMMTETSSSKTTFFTADPKYFMPVARGGYVITFDAEESIPISKTLERTQTLDLYDRLFPLIELGVYDARKSGDMIVRAFGKDPLTLLPDQVIQSEVEQRLNLLMDMAGMENKMMIQGKPVPATPNASPAHTRIHIEFMNSDAFQKDTNVTMDIAQVFSNHITGEIAAQGMREQGGVTAPTPPGSTPMPGGPMPPQGGGRSGMVNRLGGTRQPTAQMGDVLPGFKTGGERR